MVEQSAVNRWVVGSSPTSGASPPCTFWTYVLENDHGRFYIGHTENLESRLEDHNRSESFDGRFTRKNVYWRSIFYDKRIESVVQRLEPIQWFSRQMRIGLILCM